MKTITIDQIRKNGSVFISQLLAGQDFIFEYKSKPIGRFLSSIRPKKKLDVAKLAKEIGFSSGFKLTVKEMKDMYDEDTYK